jgi:hypothetical protein
MEIACGIVQGRRSACFAEGKPGVLRCLRGEFALANSRVIEKPGKLVRAEDLVSDPVDGRRLTTLLTG